MNIIHGIVEPDEEQLAYNPYAEYIDTYVPTYQNLDQALMEGIWNCAVVCTPPDIHLKQVEKCLEEDMWVLCEKPLCGLDQLEQARKLLSHKNADKVLVAYNYRYNPDMIKFDDSIVYPLWAIVARQHRDDLPEWGLLLDHVSHDVDTLRWTSGMSFDISTEDNRVRYSEEDNAKTWNIDGAMEDGTDVLIKEEVTGFDVPRVAIVTSPKGFMMMSPNRKMFTEMWRDFIGMTNREQALGATVRSDLEDAIKTQEILQKIWDIANG
jgi:hypothetical protein